MNKLRLLIRHNWLAAFIAGSILLVCLALLYFKHPKSPYHEQSRYVIRFEEIGTLSPGNRVQVNGLSRGQIIRADLTEEAVFVTIEVLSYTIIPKNSRINLVNAGLMGEREVSILLGDSEEFFREGDTLRGNYDEGTSGVSRKLSAILDTLDTMAKISREALDSVFGSPKGNRLTQLGKKVTVLSSEGSKLIEMAADHTEKSFSALKESVAQIQRELSSLKENLNHSVEGFDEMTARLDNLINEWKVLSEKIENIQTSFSKSVLGDSLVRRDIEKLSQDVDDLRNHLKNSGLKINVDIF